MSEILLKGNNLNLNPVVVHEILQLVESYLKKNQQMLYYKAVTFKIYTVNRFNVF